MKNLIFTLITIFSLSSFADDGTCTPGDRDCENIHLDQGASTIAVGVECSSGVCAGQEKASGAMLSNSVGVLNSRSGAVKASDGSAVKTEGKVKKGN